MINNGEVSDHQCRSIRSRQRLLAMHVIHSLLTRADVKIKDGKKRQFYVTGR